MRTALAGGMIFLAAVMGLPSTRQAPQVQTDQERLAAILKRSEEYCRKLDNAALDFVCFEQVTERMRYTSLETKIYVYDYQFVRKGQEMKEKRNLVSVDGKKTDEPDHPLQTVVFQYKNAFFGPVGLLSKFWQTEHDYRLVGEDTLGKERAVMIDVTPKPGMAKPHCYGRLWIREKDGGVLKIVWDQRSIGNYPSIAEWAEAHDAKPQITSFLEYGLEKNGLRFPSRNYTENAYIFKDGRKYVSAEINILYKDYKFFMVETEVKY